VSGILAGLSAGKYDVIVNETRKPHTPADLKARRAAPSA
jgi:hypothetical protein